MAENIMTHLVAGYPSMEESKNIARSLIQNGAGALEIQFPYSDPMADGPVIQEACQKALDAGFTLDQGWTMVQELAEESETPIYIMSYGGPVYNYGVDNYARRSKEAGAAGLIIPDLCIGQDEGLYEAGANADIAVIPVILSNIDAARLEEILATRPQWIYMVLRRGITGTYTDLDEAQIEILKSLQNRDIQVYVGFGIQKREQVELLAPYSAGQIVGSQLVRAIQSALKEQGSPAEYVGSLMRTLAGK